ncbi:MAG: HD-GYP domain-containing protein [Acetatifactor sp.]|nr:HD-GYP domain-containing protein [Acetatifactor sp.]
MFGVINMVAVVRDFGEGSFYSNPYARDELGVFSIVVMLLALFVFYRMDVAAFSKFSQVSVKVNWKVFIIPPILFVLIYPSVALLTVVYSDDELNVILLIAFSAMIVFLLIWAFHVIIKNITAANEIKTLSVEVMEALAHTIDAKDEYTRGHSVRVAKYSRLLAQRLGLSEEDCENVYYMALLHDIGKIGVPNAIINSKSKLTDEEYAVIKTHPGVGFDILAEIKSRPDLSIGARWHHERYDGKGYPDGKAGNDIPYFARIIAVADTYDAMTSNRSYRKYLPQDVVRNEIEKNMGTQFDPDIAKCMIAIMDEDKNYEMHE